MSHFILQSVKVVKLTDGERELYTLGFAGKDNNVSYYGPQRTCVEFFQTVLPENILSTISSYTIDVLCGGMQLKDKYNDSLSIQAEVFAKRLTSSFKNAKTVTVDKIGDDKIEWGNGNTSIRMLYPKVSISISDHMKYCNSVSVRDMENGEFVKLMLDKEKTKEKIIPLLKECKYLTAYLPTQEDIYDRSGNLIEKAELKNKLTPKEVIEVAKYAGDWNNPIKKTDWRITDINEVVSILQNDSEPERRFNIIIGFIDPQLLNNEEFANRVAPLGVSLKEFSSNIKNNIDIAGKFCEANSRNIEYTSDDLRSNKDFMLPLVISKKDALRYACDNLTDDKEIVSAALTKDAYSIQYVSQRLKDDPEICLISAEKYNWAHQYFSQRLRDICDMNNPVPGLRKLILEENINQNANTPDRKMKI